MSPQLDFSPLGFIFGLICGLAVTFGTAFIFAHIRQHLDHIDRLQRGFELMKSEILDIRRELDEGRENIHRREFRSASGEVKEGKDGKKESRERTSSLEDARMKNATLTAELKQRDTENQRLQQAYKNVVS